MGNIRAVFFDLDNTLIDFLSMKQESCRAAVTAMISAGLRMQETQAYECLMKIYVTSGIESDIAFTDFLKSEKQFDHKILAAAINAYLDAKNSYIKPYPQVKTTLNSLKRRGLFLSIVTDAPKTKAYQRLLRAKLESYFDFVVGYEDTNSAKITTLPLLSALIKLRAKVPDITNSEVLMVGDSIERDIVPAKSLGLQTALCKYGEYMIQTGNADFELRSFKDILGIL